MAEAYLGAIARDRGLRVTASSAGTLEVDRPIAKGTLQVIGTDGVDMSRHRSRLLDAQDVRGSDLVIGMTREHVREVVLIEPSAWPRTFTLKELVRRGEVSGPRWRGQSVSDWLEKVGAERRREQLMGWSTQDDVEDPMDGGPEMLRATGREILDLVGRLLDLIEPGN